MINVLGDALAAGIMAHICRKDFAQDAGTEVRAVPPSQPGTPRAWQGGAGSGGRAPDLQGWPSGQLSARASVPRGLGLLVRSRVTDSPASRLWLAQAQEAQ